MTDIQKEYQQLIPNYRKLTPKEKEAFKALSDLFIFTYKHGTFNMQQEDKNCTLDYLARDVQLNKCKPDETETA